MIKIITYISVILLFLFIFGCSKSNIETKEIKNETIAPQNPVSAEPNKTEIKVEIKNTTDESDVINKNDDKTSNKAANLTEKKEGPEISPLNYSGAPDIEKMVQEGKMPKDFMNNLPPDFDPNSVDTDKMKKYMGDFFNTPKFDLSKNTPPKFVKHNFIELDKIEKISKFRSGYGHDYSLGTGEKCRSMKHYFWPKGGEPGKPHDISWMSVKYYSPVDGTINNVVYEQNEYGQEAQFSIKSKEYPSFSFKFFHVKLLNSLKDGSDVSAGQYIGTIGEENSHGEIAVEVTTTTGRGLISFFDVMNESLFSSYKKHGVSYTKDLIISKEERDAKLLVCDYSTPDGRFTGVSGVSDFMTWQTSSDNWVTLN